MNQHLQNVLNLIQQDESLTAEQKNAIVQSLKDTDKELQITAFKLDRTEKVKRTTAILLEETIEELEQKRKDVEAQNRALEIEAALEKIRSRSLAMKKSDELWEVIAAVFEKLQELKFSIDGAAFITTFIEGTREQNAWLAGSDDQPYPTNLRLPYLDSPAINDIFSGKETGLDFFSKTYSFEEKNHWLKYAFENTGLKSMTEEFKNWILEQPCMTQCLAFGKNSLIGIHFHHQRTVSETEADILKRFSKVFDQAYIRFLDLQKAELATREAIKQSSLDRVRGEIASMRTADDLNRITPVIWNELFTLGVPFFRCGVFIIKEKQQLVHVYLSTPEGKSLAVLHLPFDGADITRNTVDHWRKQQVYAAHWDREQFIAWVSSLKSQGQVQSATNYQGAADPPEALTLQFVPFTQGMLYIGSADPLNEDQLLLAKDLAGAFSVAYARYEDFKTIENTLNDLKEAQSQLVQAEKMASLGELTAGIAHEIQNPLNFVNNFASINAELIDEMKVEIDKGNTEEVKALANDIFDNEQKIMHHGKRAESIVKGMLQHSRKSTGVKEPTDINALADEYMRLSYHGLRAKDKSFNADFKMDLDPTMPMIHVVPQDMGRVLLNLFNNAFWATSTKLSGHLSSVSVLPFSPIVILTTKNMGDKIEIRISDNGPGIPDNIRDKIFQPFFTTKPTGQGTGLGLSLAYDIIKSHGGEIRVNSNEENGTEFIIQLPI